MLYSVFKSSKIRYFYVSTLTFKVTIGSTIFVTITWSTQTTKLQFSSHLNKRTLCKGLEEAFALICKELYLAILVNVLEELFLLVFFAIYYFARNNFRSS